MIQFEVKAELGVWTDIFTASAAIETGKMSLTYFHQAITYPFGGGPKKEIPSYEDAPVAHDKLIAQAQQYCRTKNLTLWRY